MDLNIYLSKNVPKRNPGKKPEICILCSVICSIGLAVHEIIKLDYIISSHNSRKFRKVLHILNFILIEPNKYQKYAQEKLSFMEELKYELTRHNFYDKRT
jgi:hypothetical protein